LIAWGFVRSSFAQIGGALIGGVAGRTHQHMFLGGDAVHTNNAIRTRYTR
jgi:hypothetical protein